MALELIRQLVGQVPLGFEYLEYLSCLIISLFVIKSVIEFIQFVYSLLFKK